MYHLFELVVVSLSSLCLVGMAIAFVLASGESIPKVALIGKWSRRKRVFVGAFMVAVGIFNLVAVLFF